MARLNLTTRYSGADIIKTYIYYSWSGWSYSGSTASITLYVNGGGIMSPSKIDPLYSPTIMQIAASVNNVNIITKKTLLTINGTSPFYVNNDISALGFFGTYTVSFNMLSSNPPSSVSLSTIVSGSPTSSSSVTSTTSINLPGGYSPPFGSPNGRTSVYDITQTTARREAIVSSWGEYASSGTWTWYYGVGNYNISSGGSTYKTLTGLTPGTTYNYKFSITNNGNKTTNYYGTFKTLNYSTPTSYLYYHSSSNNSLTFRYSTTGAYISQIRIYLNNVLWNTIYTTETNDYITITGLLPDTSYDVSIQAFTNIGNLWGNQTANVSGVTYPNPVRVINAVVSDILPFSAKVTATSSAPGDTNLYGYTLLDSNKNIVVSEKTSGSATYNYANLIPETTYYVRIRARTRSSNVWSNYIDIAFTTPADQASVFLKLYNVWRRGKVWLKLNDEWIVAKNIYVKKNDYWYKNNNF